MKSHRISLPALVGFFALPLLLVPSLPAEDAARWSLKLPERQSMWIHVRDMQRDNSHPACAAGGLVFVGCEHNGALLALDAKTGEERWRFYTNGAIRTMPAADEKKVIFGSDDGFLYCLDHTGKQLWKSPVGQGERFLIGHQRLTSAWPVPTHPLLHGGKVFVLGGCWPADGVFMNAFEAESGELLWRSPPMDMRAMLVPHWVTDGEVYVRTYSGTGGKAAKFDIETGAATPWPKGTETPKTEPVSVPGAKDSVGHGHQSGGLLFATGEDGTLFCAGPKAGEPVVRVPETGAPAGDTESAKAVVDAAGHTEGYVLVTGLKDGAIVEGLLRNSNLHVVAVDSDATKVDRIRRSLDSRGCFDGHRLSVLHLDLQEDVLPPYFANIVVSETGENPGKIALNSLRPYGGASVERNGEKWTASRRGALEGAGNWTHEFANAAMNNSTDDSTVKAPLGILWYGGPASERKYYLPGARPAGALVMEGRMFIQGNGVIACIDAYNGLLLWEGEIPAMHIYNGTHGGGGGGLGEKSAPWKDEKASEKGVPTTQRCRATGFNWAVAPDCLYVLAADQCLRFDPATGRAYEPWKIPLPEAEGKDLCWGCPRVMGDVLVATAFRPQDMYDGHIGAGGNGGDWASDRMPMSHMFAVNRSTGELLWSKQANFGFGNRAFVVTENRAISIDLLQTDPTLAYLEEGRKIPDKKPSLRAFDLQSGEEAWSRPLDHLIKYISYIQENDILLVPNRYGRQWSTEKGWHYPGLTERQAQRKIDRPNGIFVALSGTSGEKKWEISDQHYDGPFSVIGNLILNRYGTAFDPATGKLAEKISPLTGQAESFGFKKSGCAIIGGCESLVGWRTAYHDMGTRTTVQLPGFEAGCTTSLLPASGLLNMPNFGIFHLRARAATISMVHRPSANPWREFQITKARTDTPIQRIGYNFGAPGDRIDEEGTLWVRAVRGGGELEIKTEPKELGYFSSGSGENWIGESGVVGEGTISVPTSLDQNKNRKSVYDVRLYFSEPDKNMKPGQRVFDIGLEGEVVFNQLDIASQENRLLVKEINGVSILGPLDISLHAKSGQPILSGVEIIESKGN